MKHGLVATSVLALAFLGTYGCASPPKIIDRPVVVEVERRVPVKFTIPSPCRKQDLPESATYMDALEYLLEARELLGECSDKLELVRKRMDGYET